jgi:hypothetical protein
MNLTVSKDHELRYIPLPADWMTADCERALWQTANLSRVTFTIMPRPR